MQRGEVSLGVVS